ncbi:hypothetical protein CPB85DRAFT_1368171 [Mucidula mucida]|nr:hypothetical protein CPB85DRAFT_1368171 [Mucidula mucida]
MAEGGSAMRRKFDPMTGAARVETRCRNMPQTCCTKLSRRKVRDNWLVRARYKRVSSVSMSDENGEKTMGVRREEMRDVASDGVEGPSYCIKANMPCLAVKVTKLSMDFMSPPSRLKMVRCRVDEDDQTHAFIIGSRNERVTTSRQKWPSLSKRQLKLTSMGLPMKRVMNKDA